MQETCRRRNPLFLTLYYLECLEINKLKNAEVLLNDQLDLQSSPLLNIFRNLPAQASSTWNTDNNDT